MLLRKEMLMGTTLENNPLPQMRPDAIVRIPGTKDGYSVMVGLTKQNLQMHTLFLGGTGSGKTNAMRYLIYQIQNAMTTEDVMLVFDAKLDFDMFHRPDDYIITYRENCVGNVGIWNLFRELVSDGWEEHLISANADELSEIIFSEAITESAQPFFPKAARDIFSAIIKAMTYLGKDDKQYRIKYLNNKALYEFLKKLDAKRLINFLEPIPEVTGVLKYVGNGKSDQALGVLAELQSVVSKLFNREFGRDGRFSVRAALENRGGRTIYIEYNPANGCSLKPVYRLLVDLFLKEALNPRLNRKGNVYIVCDELKMLPHLEHFEDALTFGRSLGVSVTAGIQSIQQLYEVYGEAGGKNIVGAFQNVFTFRTKDEASRQYVKSIYGENVSAIQYLLPSGEMKEEIYTGCAVEDWEIISLKLGEAIVGLADSLPFKLRIEKFRR